MARSFAVQALYQWSYTDEDPAKIIEEFLFEQGMQSSNVDIDYFQVLLSGTLSQVAAIDALMTPYLDRDMARLNPVELAVLRLSVYELAYQKAVPYAVAINEAIELAKEYGAADGHKYVNGVLHALAPSLRQEEMSK